MGGIFKTLEEHVLELKEFADEPHLLEKVKEFFDKHKYDQANIKIQRHMVSNVFKDNVDATTYEVLKGIHLVVTQTMRRRRTKRKQFV